MWASLCQLKKLVRVRGLDDAWKADCGIKDHLLISQHSAPLANTSKHVVITLYKLRKHVLVAYRAVLGVQDCEIEWTAGILSLVLITLYIIVLGTNTRVSLLQFIQCMQQIMYRRTGNYWISIILNHHNLNFYLAIGRQHHDKNHRDDRRYLQELNRTFKFSFGPQANRLEPRVPL